MLRHFAGSSLNLLKQKKGVSTSMDSTFIVICLLGAITNGPNCCFLHGVHLYSCASFSPQCSCFKHLFIALFIRLCPWRQGRSEKMSLNVAQNEVVVCIGSLSPSAASMHTCLKFLTISIRLFLAVW